MKEKAKKHKLFVKEMERSLAYLLKKRGKSLNLIVKEKERSYL